MARAGKSPRALGCALGAAALGVAVLALSQCSEEPQAPPPTAAAPEEPEFPALTEGFYKVAAPNTVLYGADGDGLKAIMYLDEGACVKVINGQRGFETAKIEYEKVYETYVKKAALSPAPECKPADVPDTELPSEDGALKGRVSTKATFLYANPDDRTPIIQLPPDQCVMVTGSRPVDNWTRVTANTPKGRFEGWGYAMSIDPLTPCMP